MPPDDNFETFSREFDRVYGTIEGPTPDGTIHTNIIPPMDHRVFTADRDGDWSNMFATPFIHYTGTGRIEADSNRVRIRGFDVVNAVAQLSNEEKRKVLELLLEAFDEAPEEKSVTVKKVNRLRELLMYSKKNNAVKSS